VCVAFFSVIVVTTRAGGARGFRDCDAFVPSFSFSSSSSSLAAAVAAAPFFPLFGGIFLLHTQFVVSSLLLVVKLFFFPNERRAPQDARPESARAKKTLLTVARKICQQTAPKSFKSLLKGCAVHNSSRDQKTTKNLVRLFDFFQEKSIGHRAKREIIFPRERERHTHTQTNT